MTKRVTTEGSKLQFKSVNVRQMKFNIQLYLDFDNCIVRVLNPVIVGEKQELRSTQNRGGVFRTQELELSQL